jgi:hypothetical protein
VARCLAIVTACLASIMVAPHGKQKASPKRRRVLLHVFDSGK